MEFGKRSKWSRCGPVMVPLESGQKGGVRDTELLGLQVARIPGVGVAGMPGAGA